MPTSRTINDIRRGRDRGTFLLEITEVQPGEYLVENDIVRREDQYGRDK